MSKPNASACARSRWNATRINGAKSFYFAVNGVPFFAKGANWIPADTFVPRLTARALRAADRGCSGRQHEYAARLGRRHLRAGCCFTTCATSYGIAVWQDFMFACGTYPTSTPSS